MQARADAHRARHRAGGALDAHPARLAFGSGTRTSYFQPGRGLVKLVFEHRDGSVSTVERLK